MDPALLKDIKYNCDVSDAQFWGYYSVCGLLMRYRDLFRSEKGLKPWAEIDRTEIGSWIEAKETRWPELENEPFRDLVIGSRKLKPFDVSEINGALKEQGLVYGAGYGMYMKPTFFLAELRSVRELDGLTVYTAGNEYVRDLFTSPGMLQEKTVFLRLEPLMMLLLYKFSELNTRQISALEDAFAAYGFPNRQLIDPTFATRLEEMASRYAEVLLQHEIAEAKEGVPEWKELLSLAGDRKAEHYLRAIKDLIADTSEHGPYKRIIESRDRGALGLTVALVDGFRRVLYPEIREAYKVFRENENWSVVEQARKEGYERFCAARDRVRDLFLKRSDADDFTRRLKELLPKT